MASQLLLLKYNFLIKIHYLINLIKHEEICLNVQKTTVNCSTYIKRFNMVLSMVV